MRDPLLVDSVSCPLPMTGVVIDPRSGADAEELIVLLHGFAESGGRFLDELEGALPARARVIALNGPFPVPVRKEKRIGYSWYFYYGGQYVVSPEPAAAFVAGGIHALNVDRLPVRLVGFSQGGYLAPFAAVRIPEVRQVLVVNGEYLVDEWGAVPAFRVDGIHGQADQVVPVGDARSSFERMLLAGAKGEFHEVPQAGHFLARGESGAPGLVSKIRQVLNKE